MTYGGLMAFGQNIYGVAVGSLVLAGVLVGASIWKPMILRGLGWVNAETSTALTGAGDNGGLF